MVKDDDVVAEDEQRLEDLHKEIAEGRRHLEDLTHEGEHYLLEDEKAAP